MIDSLAILKCYENVLITDLQEWNISEDSIKVAIESMYQVYSPETADLNCERPIVANFNDLAHRCAYLHKYAAFHTAMVKDIFLEAIVENFEFFREWLYYYNSQNNFKICSLGGGPGSDVIGLLAALGSAFGYFPVSADVIDYMIDWQFSFYSVLRELGNGWYEPFGRSIHNLDWCYIGADLLQPLTNEVIDSISQASLVTMIKFASAASCQDTGKMMEKIFESMTPGAIVLFIDNDGGGYHQLVFDAAERHGFYSIYGPHRQKTYTNEFMKLKKFGYLSCYKSRISIQILQKSYRSYNMMQYSESFANPNRRVMINNPLLPSPSTPILFCPDDVDFTKVEDESVEPDVNFTIDESIESKDFIFSENGMSPSPVNALSAENVALGSTLLPCSSEKRKFRKTKTKSCFSVKNLRHHLANKMNKIKATFRKNKNCPILK